MENLNDKIWHKFLKEFLTLTTWAIAGFCWVGLVVFLALLPTIIGIETNTTIGVVLMFISLFSPVFVFLYFNKAKREKFVKEGKIFVIGVWQLIVIMGSMIGLLLGIIIFFLLAGVIFSWLVGLGVATLLALILITLWLKK